MTIGRLGAVKPPMVGHWRPSVRLAHQGLAFGGLGVPDSCQGLDFGEGCAAWGCQRLDFGEGGAAWVSAQP
jgi:hypothetical protein